MLLTNGVLQGLTRLRKKLENLAIAIKTRNINDAHKYAKNTILILAESTHLVVEYFVDFVVLFMSVEIYIVVHIIQKEYGNVWNM